MLSDSQFRLPELEEKVLAFWRAHRVFEQSLRLREGGRRNAFRFFEGPPYANGKPGIHHVAARVFKDIILRYKSMRGYFVPRKAGWDTHGLPVEIEAEKQLGINSKSEIEKLGVALFNQKAKEAVWRYKDEWEKMTERIGYWIDLKDAYVTYENDYLESLWWIFASIHKRGLLKKLYKVVPWCPRCQTPLSSHELGQPGVYKKTKDPSVYLRFPVRRGRARGKGREYLLVWTTTPWTIPANVAVAVHPSLVYTKFRVGDDILWSSVPPPNPENKPVEVLEKVSGKKLIGLSYEPPYPTRGRRASAWYTVVGGKFVDVEEGTGFVHIAPAFGEEDLKLLSSLWEITPKEIPVTIDERGIVAKGLPGAGKFIKEADRDILQDLALRGFLYHAGTIEHEYPFCWRCSHLLIYLARSSWFIELRKLRDDLLKTNKKIHWIPGHIQEGRFGEWLKEGKDWCVSRERYWGTPLPIWECVRCGEIRVAGSLGELQEWAPRRNTFFFMRHGEARHDIEGWIAAGPERGGKVSKLTARGRKDAEAAARKLKKEGIDLIVTSPYFRTRETARIVSRITKARVVVDPRLSEYNTGTFNGQPVEKFHAFFERWIERFSKTPPGGENLSDVRRRMAEAVLAINGKYDRKRILVISHGDPLWVLEAALTNTAIERLRDIPYPDYATPRNVAVPNWPFTPDGTLDLHRPFIDAVTLRCDRCRRGIMRRVREVADVWFDSGAMPFASWHYPFEHKDLIDKKLRFPADFIAEGIDQTRGWFYTLLAVSVLLEQGIPYHHVVVLGLLLDKYGQKMSKSKGNVVEPWAVIGNYGVDSVRWYFFVSSDPSEPKRFDEEELGKIVRRLFLIFYNAFVFWKTYADQSAVDITHAHHILDRWILARLAVTTDRATAALDRYEIGIAARELEHFIDDLSRWYIRRSRRRFQDGNEKQGSSAVLRHCLLTAAKLFAPFTPFFAEGMYQSIRETRDALSVHLTDWPKTEKRHADRELLAAMDCVRKVSSDALAKRAEAGIKVRQPLASLKVKRRKFPEGLLDKLSEILKDEVNVKQVTFDVRLKNSLELDTVITPELYREGILREVIRTVQQLRQEASLKVGDAIEVQLSASPKILSLVREKEGEFTKSVGAVRLAALTSKTGLRARYDAELDSKLEDENFWVAIRKV